jgi:hypothetical protein
MHAQTREPAKPQRLAIAGQAVLEHSWQMLNQSLGLELTFFCHNGSCILCCCIIVVNFVFFCCGRLKSVRCTVAVQWLRFPAKRTLCLQENLAMHKCPITSMMEEVEFVVFCGLCRTCRCNN